MFPGQNQHFNANISHHFEWPQLKPPQPQPWSQPQSLLQLQHQLQAHLQLELKLKLELKPKHKHKLKLKPKRAANQIKQLRSKPKLKLALKLKPECEITCRKCDGGSASEPPGEPRVPLWSSLEHYTRKYFLAESQHFRAKYFSSC